MKTCTKCKVSKSRDEFYRRGGLGPFAHHLKSRCIDCEKNYVKEHRKLKPRQYQNSWFKYEYGITLSHYQKLLAAQNGLCAICHGPPNNGKTSLVVDHCHLTGRVRGLLCDACNKAIGILDDDPALLRSAASYLERPVR